MFAFLFSPVQQLQGLLDTNVPAQHNTDFERLLFSTCSLTCRAAARPAGCIMKIMTMLSHMQQAMLDAGKGSLDAMMQLNTSRKTV